MKIAKKKVRIQSPLVSSIIDLERTPEKVIKKGKYIVIKCHDTPGDNDMGSYEIYGGGSLEEWLIWKDKLLETLDGQCIGTGPLKYTFTDAKATFNQTALDIGISAVDNFNKVLAEMTKHAFPVYA